jgi:outer membrane receptor for ferrienterochelin and colicins
MHRKITGAILVLLLLAFDAYTQSTNMAVQKWRAGTRSPADSSKLLREVVVTGQYAPQALRNSVYRVRVISQEMIRMRNATDMQGVLNNELGVRFSNDLTLGETDVQIMGMSGQNVKVLLDGVPLIDRGSTKQSLSQIDIHSVDRVEIVEGPMSVIYGTDALAGVINIITKKGNSNGSRFSAGANIQEESAGNEYGAFTNKGVHNENIYANWNPGKWFLNGSFTRNAFGGWQGQNTGRAKAWSPRDQWLGSGRIGYHTARLNAWYRLNYLDETIHALGNINPNTSLATNQDYVTDRYTHQAEVDWRPGKKWSFNGSASYQDYTRATRTSTLNTQTGDRRLALGEGEQDVSKFHEAFFRGTSQYRISEKISLQPGLEFKRDNASGERIEGSPTISDYSVFVSSEIKPVRQINIRPGIRFSKNSTYDAPPVIPSLNTKFTLGKNWDLRLSYARGFRAPALRELYFWFFDANHSIKGNPGLRAEYSNSFNGSLSREIVNEPDLAVASTVSGFYNDFNNRIDLALAVDPANPNVYTYINVSRYKTTGGSWENTFRWKQLQATLGLSYIGRYNQYFSDSAYDKNNQLPEFMWSPEVNGNILYSFKKAGVQAGLFYKYTGELPIYEIATVNNQENVHLAKTSAYHWMDVNVSKTINPYITLSAGIKNLFNITNVQNTSADLGGAHSTGGPVPMSYGRSVFLGLKFSYSKKEMPKP